MVLALEDHDALAPRGGACEADHIGHRLARGKSKLPLRQAPATDEFLGDDDRVLGRKVELGSCAHSLLRRLDHRLRRVTGGRHRDPQAEVVVAMAVDVGERRSLGRDHERWRMVVEESHPGEGDTERHRPSCALAQCERLRAVADETSVLATLQCRKGIQIETCRRGGCGDVWH